MSRIVVVGAGVTGLTTACLLSEKGYDVTIVAKKFSYDGFDDPYYCSNHAGANWQSMATATDTLQQELDKPAYLKFLHLLQTEPKSGIAIKTHKNYISKETYQLMKGNYRAPWYKDFVQDFKIIPRSELPKNIGFGTSYTGIVINTSVYLSYLLGKCIDNGVVYKRKTLLDISEAQFLHHTKLKAHAVVNCTGLSSKMLKGVEDPNLVSIKGQVLLVENSCPDFISVQISDPEHPLEKVTLMPRKEGGTLIGGSSSIANYNGDPDFKLAERFKLRALKFCPQLIDPTLGNPKTLVTVRHMVGFRPVRKNGVRIERDANIRNLVHNYGIGGTGFQSSYGVCEKAVVLVDQIIHRSKL